ncbi:MAG: HDIG domain-containing protein [Clostridiales bacterium]|nr:HDIG domain-containing protein [Clostridiales bacterium]
MERLKSQKIKKWSKKDVVKTVFIVLLNLLFIVEIMLGAILLNGIGRGANPQDFFAYFNDKESIKNFVFLMAGVLLIVGITSLHLILDNRNKFRDTENLKVVFAIIEITLLFCYFAGRYISTYLRPLFLGVLLAHQFLGRRTAMFTNVAICLLVFLMDALTNFTVVDNYALYSSLILGFAGGVIAIYFVNKEDSRMQVLVRSLILAIPYAVFLVILNYGRIDKCWVEVVLVVVASLLSAMFYIILMPIMESMFKKTTSYRLIELTDHSAPLIKRMIEVAPGTFNHVTVVSNLAEACAIAIGEDPLLARAVAYYHDIGKLKQPEFFKENQMDGKDYHKDLMPELSTSIIKAHTKDGAELIKKFRLPKYFGDVCREHHGTMPILFFYDKARKYTDGEVNIKDFCHFGPKPQTKIAAIIMIVDSAEAASRTLKNRSREDVYQLVEHIIEDRLALGQFDECEITMKEINIIKNTIVNNLTGVYHKRIEYPDLDISKITKESE